LCIHYIEMFSAWTYDIDNEIKKNIIQNISPYCLELVPAFEVRNESPEHIFDNLVGKCASYHLLKSKILVSDLIYNKYWLNNEEFKDISLCEFQKLDTVHIEYWFKSGLWEEKKTNFHEDKDEYIAISNNSETNNVNTPMFTSLIYMSTNKNTPTMIINENKKIGISFPESDKTIVFNGGNDLHGHYPNFLDEKNEERFLIAFNVFLKNVKYTVPLNINQLYQWYYMKEGSPPTILPTDIDISISKREIKDIEINTTPDTFEQFYSDLHNDTHETNSNFILKRKIKDEILLGDSESNVLSYNIIVNTDIIEWVLFDNKLDESENGLYNELENEIVTGDVNSEPNTQKNITPYSSKFYNVFVETKLVDPNFCEWLCVEAELITQKLYSGWKNDRHDKYPTHDISIDDLNNSCMRLILMTFQNKIGNLIFNRFNINKNYHKLDIVDCFVVKYNEATQTLLEEHTDDSDITAIIGLSDIHDFSGGGTEFESGIQVHYDQGDVLIFGSKYRHKGLPITSGTRMILTFFIDIIVDED
jgi:hypothetical protein